MKYIAMTFMAIVVCFGMAGSVSAAVTINRDNLGLVIQDKAQFRLYALGQANYWRHGVNSGGVAYGYPGSVTDTNGVSDCTETALMQMFSVPLNPHFWDNSAQIGEYGALESRAGFTMFYGGINYYGLDNGDSVPFLFWIQGVPLLSGVTWARVDAHLPDGSMSSQDLQIYMGQFVMQEYMVGADNATLTVKFDDGQEKVYGLSKPKALIKTAQNLAHIDGHYICNGSAQKPTIKIVESYRLPTAFIDLPHNRSVVVDVEGVVQENDNTISLEYASAMVVIPLDGSPEKTFPLRADKPTHISLRAGKYRFYFVWKRYGQQANTVWFGAGRG